VTQNSLSEIKHQQPLLTATPFPAQYKSYGSNFHQQLRLKFYEEIVRCYIRSIALCDDENWTLQKLDHKYWCHCIQYTVCPDTRYCWPYSSAGRDPLDHTLWKIFQNTNLMHNSFILQHYTGCPRRNGQNFGRVFLMLNYTDITQNTYIQSLTVTEIMAIEKCGLLGRPRTVRRPWRHTHPLRMPGNETALVNIAMQWPWRDNEQPRPT